VDTHPNRKRSGKGKEISSDLVEITERYPFGSDRKDKMRRLKRVEQVFLLIVLVGFGLIVHDFVTGAPMTGRGTYLLQTVFGAYARLMWFILATGGIVAIIAFLVWDQVTRRRGADSAVSQRFLPRSGPDTVAARSDSMSDNLPLPTASDFQPGTTFVIKEFDVPLVQLPNGKWMNWYGGTPRQYDTQFLKVDNNWPAESFEEWLEIVKASIKKET